MSFIQIQISYFVYDTKFNGTWNRVISKKKINAGKRWLEEVWDNQAPGHIPSEVQQLDFYICYKKQSAIPLQSQQQQDNHMRLIMLQ